MVKIQPPPFKLFTPRLLPVRSDGVLILGFAKKVPVSLSAFGNGAQIGTGHRTPMLLSFAGAIVKSSAL
jgi:hypothetical protein